METRHDPPDPLTVSWHEESEADPEPIAWEVRDSSDGFYESCRKRERADHHAEDVGGTVHAVMPADWTPGGGNDA